MAFRAAIFDLDGTLTNTLTDIANAMNRALTLHGLPDWPEDAYRYLVGDGADKLAQRACRDRTDMFPVIRRTYQEYYQLHTHDATRPYDGVEAMLRALHAQGIRLAVFSNKPHADTCEVVRHFFPDIPFDVVRGQLPGVPVKPDPAGALAVAQALEIPPVDFVYLGDTGTDMACAVRAGMYPAGALWGFRDAQELTDCGARTLLREPDALLRLFGL